MPNLTFCPPPPTPPPSTLSPVTPNSTANAQKEIYLCAAAFGLADATFSLVWGAELGSRWPSSPEASFSVARMAGSAGTASSMFIAAYAVPFAVKLKVVTYGLPVAIFCYMLSSITFACLGRLSRRVRFLPPEAMAVPQLAKAAMGEDAPAKGEPGATIDFAPQAPPPVGTT